MNRRSFFGRSIAAIAAVATASIAARANQLSEVAQISSNQRSKTVVLADRFRVMHSAAGAPKSVFIVQNGMAVIDSSVIDSALIKPTQSIKVAVNPSGTQYMAGIGSAGETGALA